MLRTPCLPTLAACFAAGFVLVASIFMHGERAFAEQAQPAGNGPQSEMRRPDLKSTLDEGDELAALEALQVALSEVGDGSTFVWYRGNGRLSGVFNPTASFKDQAGRVCRHLRLMLTSGVVSRKAEGVACREAGGIWSLEG